MFESAVLFLISICEIVRYVSRIWTFILVSDDLILLFIEKVFEKYFFSTLVLFQKYREHGNNDRNENEDIEASSNASGFIDICGFGDCSEADSDYREKQKKQSQSYFYKYLEGLRLS